MTSVQVSNTHRFSEASG